MARLILIEKNLKRKNLIKKYQAKRKKLKMLLKDKKLTMDSRLGIQSKLQDLPRSSSRIRYRNRCELTGRARGVYRKFGLSRIKIRELSLSGKLPGVIKSSW
ncbi:MAG: 30S ribosomal protein S14 [Alphaproteobacteria bacterium MarineAlpha5_Bin11]|nr:30S ribosomal protein S14 [Pelagibacteraceae bacterium]PPR43499.1 MAG: 30S ribosomal protein S14 [Alphaproteobacteria bacterium MarineAlpha5_Bin11]PPR51757.1 MAG: 30S ribosomal protein S14 [Alphaproteobacteria bacterium MarineAlpha5_Bin10]|tara:strand:- start:22876 stop:23181 length:306 start_codon:yes stop_codon:yes gene_type:complete